MDIGALNRETRHSAPTSGRCEYGPFGEVLRATGPMAKANPIRFSTQYTDDETDLVCYLHRGYNPSTGRWLSRDPINEPGFNVLIRSQNPFNVDEEKNLRGFVRNNPANDYDPLGLSCCICFFKFSTGKLTINKNCRGVLAIWVIDENNAPAAGASAGSTVSADGYVLGGTTYKIDGSVCVEINCVKGVKP